jgi:hypothetical protein
MDLNFSNSPTNSLFTLNIILEAGILPPFQGGWGVFWKDGKSSDVALNY